MFDEEVVGVDLALLGVGDLDLAVAVHGVLIGHVVLELLGVGAGGRDPVRDLVDGVEVVGEVLGLGVADLPIGGETGGSLAENIVSNGVAALEESRGYRMEGH